MSKKFIENLVFEWDGLDEYIDEYYFSDFIGKPSKSLSKLNYQILSIVMVLVKMNCTSHSNM